MSQVLRYKGIGGREAPSAAGAADGDGPMLAAVRECCQFFNEARTGDGATQPRG